MAFISVADELTRKSLTSVENKFITKYLPELEPVAVKIYLYALFLAQNGQNGYTLADLADKFSISEEQATEYFRYLEDFELVSIISYSPFEIKILDCENYYGKPKKLHPEKYEGLYEELQAIITGRMISQDEFRNYLILLEDYSLERNALVMIVNYCVNLKGDDISSAYIKKVAKNFCSDGVTTAAAVEEKLSSYTVSSSAIIKILSACSIKRRPEVADGEAFARWTSLGFTEDALIAAAKGFKTKSVEKLNAVVDELYRNGKFDAKEIEDYRKTKQSLRDTAIDVAKSLGVYVADPTPYVENYISVWCGYGFSRDGLKKIANYCFLSGKNTFDLMGNFIGNLYDNAYVDDDSVESLLNELAEDDVFIKRILSACGLSRKIISYDRIALTRWRDWGFNEQMILKAAELSSGKNNPVAAMNYLLSQWKNDGVFTVEQIPVKSGQRNEERKSFKAIQRERDLTVLKNLYNNSEDW